MIDNIANKHNVFRQSNQILLAQFKVPGELVDHFANSLEPESNALSHFEDNDDESEQIIQAYFNGEVKQQVIEEIICNLAQTLSTMPPVISWTTVEDIDWVSKVQSSFPPLTIGNYFIHNSSYSGLVSAKHAICIDACRAFGTGEHETTSTCLEALDILARDKQFNNMLDVGCGSGILSIAMAKTWRKNVLAVDIDHQSTITTKYNAKINSVSHLIQVYVSNGYSSSIIKQHQPFDLIVSNILAKPLVKLAKHLNDNLAPKGICVLSGMLAQQANMVLSSHLTQGLYLLDRVNKNQWSTLIMMKD
jgi:ribosomal protein L11 methyltransferase